MNFINMILNGLKIAGRFIARGVRKLCGLFFKNRNNVTEVAKAAGGVATAVSSTIMAGKAVSNLIQMRKAAKTNNQAATNGAHLDANGKVVGGKKKGNNGKRKSQTVTEQFAQELEDNSKFVRALTPDEKSEYEKQYQRQVKNQANTDITTINSTQFGAYHVWDRNRSLAYNELMELWQYYKTFNEYSGDKMRADAAKQILERFSASYRNLYPNSKHDWNEATPPKTLEAAKAEAQGFAREAKSIREHFDEMVDAECMHEDGAIEYEDPVNPISGGWGQPEIEGSLPLEESPDPISLNIKHAGGKVVNGKMLPEIYLISNLVEPSTLPSYYQTDPDPKRKLGNIVADGFVPIIQWRPGIPHVPACTAEIEHDYDWSEFEGQHAHPQISSIREAFESMGASWCNNNLECAHVFNDLYLQHPCIYPGHPDYNDFRKRFSEAYWDLCRVVPGLGDCGRVLAHPFAGGVNDPKEAIEDLKERGDYNLIYGLSNPPSMEKVFYEILRFGTLCFLEKIEQLEKMYPVLKFNIRSPLYLADLYYQALLTEPVLNDPNSPFPDEVFEAVYVALQDYGVTFQEPMQEVRHEKVSVTQQSTDGFACSIEELDD